MLAESMVADKMLMKRVNIENRRSLSNSQRKQEQMARRKHTHTQRQKLKRTYNSCVNFLVTIVCVEVGGGA
jgi:CMP-N-acetylneuraminic acid synthetase